MKRLFPGVLAAALLMRAGGVLAQAPDCTRSDAWPAGMALTHLQNAGVIERGSLNPAQTRVVRLASEKIGDNRYRQIHRIRFVTVSGKQVVAITVSEASKDECSMSNVDVYRVSAKLGDYTPTVPAQTDALPIPPRPDASGKRHASPPPTP